MASKAVKLQGRARRAVSAFIVPEASAPSLAPVYPDKFVLRTS